jgi:DNA-binding NarL/FixJ family response regulator
MAIIIATADEAVFNLVKTDIGNINRFLKLLHVKSRSELKKALDENKQALCLIEANFSLSATPWTVLELNTRNRRARVGVFTIGAASEKWKAKFYSAGAVGLINYRKGKEETMKYLEPLVNNREDTCPAIQQEKKEADFIVLKSTKLTNREMEITLLVCDGKNNREIGGYLGISEGQVKNVKKEIYRKCVVENSVELLHFAIHKGWYRIPTDEEVEKEKEKHGFAV